MSDTQPVPDQSPDATAAALLVARDQLVAVVETCGAGDWAACPLAAQGDPRPTRVIADHVADAYRYIGEWIRELVAGGTIEVDSALVDDLNAKHAGSAQGISKEEVVERLRSQGDAFAALVKSLSDDDMTLGDGRVRRLARIGLLHTDDHRRELEESLGTG